MIRRWMKGVVKAPDESGRIRLGLRETEGKHQKAGVRETLAA
jgi:hypothetical protein